MRRTIHFKTSGQYDVNRILNMIRSFWPEALVNDVEHPGLYEDRVSPEARRFFIYETVLAIRQRPTTSIEMEVLEEIEGVGVWEFTLGDTEAKVSTWPWDGPVANYVTQVLVEDFGWKPFRPNKDKT